MSLAVKRGRSGAVYTAPVFGDDGYLSNACSVPVMALTSGSVIIWPFIKYFSVNT